LKIINYNFEMDKIIEKVEINKFGVELSLIRECYDYFYNYHNMHRLNYLVSLPEFIEYSDNLLEKHSKVASYKCPIINLAQLANNWNGPTTTKFESFEYIKDRWDQEEVLKGLFIKDLVKKYVKDNKIIYINNEFKSIK